MLVGDVGDGDGGVEVIANAGEDVRVSYGGFDDGVELFEGEADVPVKDDGRDDFRVDMRQDLLTD